MECQGWSARGLQSRKHNADSMPLVEYRRRNETLFARRNKTMAL